MKLDNTNQTTSCLYTDSGILSQIQSFSNSYIIERPIDDNLTDEQIKSKMLSINKDLNLLLNLIEKRNLQNEQWCLDGMDEINKQSVRF